MQISMSEVRQVFADLTRYPVEILEPEADLEEDLGIDSVKQMEILSTFKDKYNLPQDFQVAPEELRTIGGITSAMQKALNVPKTVRQDMIHLTRGVVSNLGSRAEPAALPPKKTASVNGHVDPSALGNGSVSYPPASMNGHHQNGQYSTVAQAPSNGRLPEESVLHEQDSAADRLLQSSQSGDITPALTRTQIDVLVVDCLEEVTRYPRDLLQLEADLEEDLGIDSVKMAEALALVAQRLTLPADTQVEPGSIKTIGDMAAAIYAHLETQTTTEGVTPSNAQAPEPGVMGMAQPSTGNRSILNAFQAKPLDGKLALVTGSGHGIGRSIVEELAELGATVIVNSFHSRQAGEALVETLRNRGLQAHHIWGSVAQEAQLDRIFDEIETRFGYLDFFVSNASNGMLGPLDRIERNHWDRAFRTNILGLHQGAFRAAKLMEKRGGGKIVTLSSPGAQRYIEHFGCMGPIKAAVESLTRYLAIELGPKNIQVNSVSAGPIYGDLLNKYPDSQRLIPYWESLSAGNRLGEARDVANFVAYLLSSAANKISGSVLLVDAGGSQRI